MQTNFIVVSCRTICW